jgi:hypothetical protein
VPGSVTATYSSLPDAADGNGGVSVREQANAIAAVFPADAFARTVAQTILGQEYAGQPVMLQNVKDLTLASASSTPPSASAPFTFTLSGKADIVWVVDPGKIAAAVAGKSRAAAEPVLTGFPEIHKAYLTLRPFWRSTFPDDPADIEVTVNTPSPAE